LLERSLQERANERPLNERSFGKIVLAKEQPMNVPSLFYLMNGKRRTNERQKNGGNLPTLKPLCLAKMGLVHLAVHECA
jgi:hypothetical protein